MVTSFCSQQPVAPVIICHNKFRDFSPTRTNRQQFRFRRNPEAVGSTENVQLCSYSPTSKRAFLQNSALHLAASLSVLLCPDPAKAGFLSGFPGIETTPGPQLPQIDFLNRFNEENQKKYAEFDSKFKESPLLKKLLEQSQKNKEKNRKEIQDKYCIRGAEWGVGDCSAEGMSPEDRENFISMLKQKAGVK